MSSLIILVPLHKGERNVNKLGFGFECRGGVGEVTLHKIYVHRCAPVINILRATTVARRLFKPYVETISLPRHLTPRTQGQACDGTHSEISREKHKHANDQGRGMCPS